MPFQYMTEPVTKLDPLTVMGLISGSPAVAELGDRLVITGVRLQTGGPGGWQAFKSICRWVQDPVGGVLVGFKA